MAASSYNSVASEQESFSSFCSKLATAGHLIFKLDDQQGKIIAQNVNKLSDSNSGTIVFEAAKITKGTWNEDVFSSVINSACMNRFNVTVIARNYLHDIEKCNYVGEKNIHSCVSQKLSNY